MHEKWQCVKCEHGSTTAKETSPGLFQCERCQHPFAAESGKDHLIDLDINQAIERVSDGNTLRFHADQVAYELMRYINKGRKGFWAAIFRMFYSPGSPRYRSRQHPPITLEAAKSLAEIYLKLNPGESGVTLADGNREAGKDAGSGRQEADLGAVTFDRVVICQWTEIAEVLLANQVPLHFACPVLSPDGGSQEVSRDIIGRLKGNVEPFLVLVFHDLTPAGMAFVEEVFDGEAWFRDHQQALMVNLGLNPAHLDRFGEILLPLEEIPGGKPPDRWKGVPDGLGIEWSVLTPMQMLRALAKAIATLQTSPQLHGMDDDDAEKSAALPLAGAAVLTGAAGVALATGIGGGEMAAGAELDGESPLKKLREGGAAGRVLHDEEDFLGDELGALDLAGASGWLGDSDGDDSG